MSSFLENFIETADAASEYRKFGENGELIVAYLEGMGYCDDIMIRHMTEERAQKYVRDHISEINRITTIVTSPKSVESVIIGEFMETVPARLRKFIDKDKVMEEECKKWVVYRIGYAKYAIFACHW